ncbi:hypothetical protein K8Z61_09385 [Nocardioides sp. TRM66260-LWL]|uniref:hypothetical protein n=1 Tax=Nocardioides sp. TRM66260-LWL TaxID=2874478 RepID=UPI001CC387FF|nr:hypothetical protein [Nocardioides sp. TRM66260-LWL]MBZ5734707.1 hypothetical protein [Nocardioides sp. TRM66260-LWL]
MSLSHHWRRLRRTRRCRRLYGADCPHVERHSPRRARPRGVVEWDWDAVEAPPRVR